MFIKTQTKRVRNSLIILATAFVAFFVFMGGDVSAVKTIVGGVTVSTDGWENSTNGLGENKVFLSMQRT
jgi:hypothetical protein